MLKGRSRIGVLAPAALMAAGLLSLGSAAQAETVSVAVTAIVDHPALEAVRDGVRDELAEAGYEAGSTLVWSYESAQGNPATAAQIARKFVGEAPDVIVPISTPSAQAVAATTRDIPIVFSAVTDPVGARLVSNLNAPGANITGVTDLVPIETHLDLVRAVVPGATRLGVVYNPGEANAVTLVDLIKEAAPAMGMEVVTAASPRSSDVLAAARSLVGKVDAFYVGTDNTVVSGLEALVKVAMDNDIPFVAGDTDSVNRGAAAAVGFDYYDVGRQTGKLVVRILEGEDPGSLPVQALEILRLHVNPEAAAAMGVTLSDEMLERADQVVQ